MHAHTHARTLRDTPAITHAASVGCAASSLPVARASKPRQQHPPSCDCANTRCHVTCAYAQGKGGKGKGDHRGTLEAQACRTRHAAQQP